jgi:acyl dehydratase
MKASEISVGQTFEKVVVEDLKRTQLVMYSGASGDYNPLHTDDLYCKEAAGYPGVFAHGMLTMGMTGTLVTDLFGAENVRKYGVRFTNQVWPGDTLHSTATVEEVTQEDGDPVVKLKVETTNQDGKVVVSGYASARVDP